LAKPLHEALKNLATVAIERIADGAHIILKCLAASLPDAQGSSKRETFREQVGYCFQVSHIPNALVKPFNQPRDTPGFTVPGSGAQRICG
jgi:hypothetical protein